MSGKRFQCARGRLDGWQYKQLLILQILVNPQKKKKSSTTSRQIAKNDICKNMGSSPGVWDFKVWKRDIRTGNNFQLVIRCHDVRNYTAERAYASTGETCRRISKLRWQAMKNSQFLVPVWGTYESLKMNEAGWLWRRVWNSGWQISQASTYENSRMCVRKLELQVSVSNLYTDACSCEFDSRLPAVLLPHKSTWNFSQTVTDWIAQIPLV